MFLCRFHEGDAIRVGARVDQDVVADLHTALVDVAPGFGDPMLKLIAAGAAGLAAAGQLVADPPSRALRRLAEIRLTAPLMPPKMRNFSVYEGHIRNAVGAVIELRAGRWVAELARRTGLAGPPPHWYRRALYYKGNPTSVIGPYDDIVRPAYTTQLDYELELAVVIGAPGKDLRPENAMNHVFGYTLLDDVSARDVLAGELFSQMGPTKGKDFDTGNVVGPWLATREEIPDPAALTGRIRVNGIDRATCVTAGMRHDIADILAEASRGETLVPGELIGAGCCTGGSGIELKKFLCPGDVIELTLEPLGTQRNRVTA